MDIRTSRVISILVVALVVAAAPAAQADSSLFFGFNFPTGEFADITTSGWSMGGYSTTNVAPTVDVGGYISYTDFVVDTTQPGAGAQFGPSLNAWEFAALGQIKILFLKGYLGLGFANYSGFDENGDSKRQNAFAWPAGVAAHWTIIEGRLGYHQINTDGISPGWVSLTVGILF